MAARACYTRHKEPLTPHKICQMLRTFAKQHQLTSDACPYFSEKETMELNQGVRFSSADEGLLVLAKLECISGYGF